jgi:hypothetical protein
MDTAANRPAAQPGAGSPAARAGAPPVGVTNEPSMLEPSQAEVDAWAERERRRREAFLSGPTAEERAAWIEAERERRLARLTPEPPSEAARVARRAQRSLREAQLAAEGAVSLLWRGLGRDGPVGLLRKWSRRGMEVLVRAGREWEQELGEPSREPGRRVPLDEDAS